MTREQITAELSALDAALEAFRNRPNVSIIQWLSSQPHLGCMEIADTIERGLSSRIAALNQISADLDSKQVTAKQIERYTLPPPPAGYHWSPDPALRDVVTLVKDREPRCLNTAEPLAREQIERYPVLSHSHRRDPLAVTVGAIYPDEPAAIPATLADESHAEASP